MHWHAMLIRQKMHFTLSRERIAFYCFKVVMQGIHLYTSNTLHCPTSSFIYMRMYIYIVFYHIATIYTEIHVPTNQHYLCHSTFQFPMSPGSRLHTQPSHPFLGSTSLWRLDAIYLQRHLSWPQLRLAQPSGWKNPSESAWPNWGWISWRVGFLKVFFRPFLNLIF